MDAIKNSGPALGILCADGIVIATEKQTTSILLEKTIQSEKIYQVDSHVYCVASGLTADSNYLIDYAREVGQDFRKTYRNPMQVEQLVMRVSDLKQSYTQYGGMRPFGTSFIFAGYDSRNGFGLLTTDPAGNYLKWKAIAHGSGEANANSYLQKEYADGITVDRGVELALETICKTLDSASPPAEKLEVVVFTKAAQSDTLVMKELSIEELKVELKKKEERDKKKST